MPELSGGRVGPLDDAFALAQVQSFNSYLCSTVHVAHAHRMRGYRWADDPAAILEMQRKAPQAVGDCFALIEHDKHRVRKAAHFEEVGFKLGRWLDVGYWQRIL